MGIKMGCGDFNLNKFEISTYAFYRPNHNLKATVKCQHNSIDPKNNQCRDCYEDFNDYGDEE